MGLILDYLKRKKRFLIITSILITANIYIWFFYEPNEPEKQPKKNEYSDTTNIV